MPKQHKSKLNLIDYNHQIIIHFIISADIERVNLKINNQKGSSTTELAQ